MLRSRGRKFWKGWSRKFWKVGVGSRKFWKGQRWSRSRIFYLRLRNLVFYNKGHMFCIHHVTLGNMFEYQCKLY